MRRTYPPGAPLQLEVIEDVRRQRPVRAPRIGGHLADPRPAGGPVEPVGLGAGVGGQPEEPEPVGSCPLRRRLEERPAEAAAAPVRTHCKPPDLTAMPPVLAGRPH